MQGGECCEHFSPAAGSFEASGAALSFPCADYTKKAHGNASIMLDKCDIYCYGAHIRGYPVFRSVCRPMLGGHTITIKYSIKISAREHCWRQAIRNTGCPLKTKLAYTMFNAMSGSIKVVAM